MKCKGCGRKLKPEAKKCPECGQKIGRPYLNGTVYGGTWIPDQD